jgi:probable phosphoglycerate mutase
VSGPGAVTHVVLVRHGLPVTGVLQDPGLSPEGEQQARLAGDWLRWESPAGLLASPFQRAAETAQWIAKACELGVEYDDDLREWDAPRPAQYITPELLGSTDRGRAFAEGRFADFVPPHDREALRDRMIGVVHRAARRWPGGTVILVSHGGAINNLMSAVLGVPESFFFNPGYTSLCRLQVRDGGRMVPVSVNETGHLVGTRAQAG